MMLYLGGCLSHGVSPTMRRSDFDVTSAAELVDDPILELVVVTSRTVERLVSIACYCFCSTAACIVQLTSYHRQQAHASCDAPVIPSDTGIGEV